MGASGFANNHNTSISGAGKGERPSREGMTFGLEGDIDRDPRLPDPNSREQRKIAEFGVDLSSGESLDGIAMSESRSGKR